MIAIAILWIAVWRKQQPPVTATAPVKVQEQLRQTANETDLVSGNQLAVSTGVVTPPQRIVEIENSQKTNLVKQYFAHLQAKEFKEACSIMSSAKCSSIRLAAVQAFSQEFLKLKNGYEYISVKDFWLKSPSGKSVVCVKYSYRYKEDSNQWLISEILSFYIDEDVGKRVVTDRVCEKKYKDGVGERPCPVQATQNFCIGKIR